MKSFFSPSLSSSLFFVFAAAVVHGAAAAEAVDEVFDTLSWSALDDAVLPTPLSDMTATYIDGGDEHEPMIYIAGGCDSPKGNTYRDADGLELDFFLCESYSDRLIGFKPSSDDGGTTTTIVTDLKPMPRPRYRHTAVEADNKLWLIGGRDIPNDEIIPEVDVYDPATDTWKTVGKIPTEYLMSDGGSFTNKDKSKIYVVGGYNQNYYDPDALTTTFSFDVKDALSQSSSSGVDDLIVTRMADLNTQRGDIHAVTSNGDTKAYIAGGFAVYLCQPLKTVEVYDTERDVWEFVPSDLLSGRGDQAMVSSNDKIYSIGGEVSHPDSCEAPELVPPLSHISKPVDDVELFDTALLDDPLYDKDHNGIIDNSWTDIVDIPESRFRFNAASWPGGADGQEEDRIYVFGGQTAFEDECKCFPTTDEITTIVRENNNYDDDKKDADSSSSAAAATIVRSTIHFGQKESPRVGINSIFTIMFMTVVSMMMMMTM